MNLELYFYNMQVCLYRRVTFELFWIRVSPKMMFDRSVTASWAIVTGLSGCCLGEVSSRGNMTSRYPGASESYGLMLPKQRKTTHKLRPDRVKQGWFLFCPRDPLKTGFQTHFSESMSMDFCFFSVTPSWSYILCLCHQGSIFGFLVAFCLLAFTSTFGF